jgi:hypothetical protein
MDQCEELPNGKCLCKGLNERKYICIKSLKNMGRSMIGAVALETVVQLFWGGHNNWLRVHSQRKFVAHLHRITPHGIMVEKRCTSVIKARLCYEAR